MAGGCEEVPDTPSLGPARWAAFLARNAVRPPGPASGKPTSEMTPRSKPLLCVPRDFPVTLSGVGPLALSLGPASILLST